MNSPGGNAFKNQSFIGSVGKSLESKYLELMNQVSKVTKQIDNQKSDNRNIEEDVMKIKHKNIGRLYV